jgi:Protein kinase domain
MEELEKPNHLSESTESSRTDGLQGPLPNIFFHAPREDRSQIRFEPALHDRAVLKELIEKQWQDSGFWARPLLLILAGAFACDAFLAPRNRPFPLVFFEAFFGALAIMFVLGCLFYLIWTISRMGQPNCINLLDSGLELEGRAKTRFIYWSQIERVYVVRTESGRTGPLTFELYSDNNRSRQDLLLPLDAFGPKNLEKLLSGLRRHLPTEKIDATVIQELENIHPRVESNIFYYPANAAIEPTYTSLWLSVLQNSRERVKLSALEPGITLQDGSYVIVSKLGSGGQGTVYLANTSAEDEHQSLVALKEFILPAHAGEEAVRRVALEVEREASLLSRLNHKQIVRMIDSFVEDWRIYLVQEYLEGKSLQNVVAAEGQMDVSAAIGLGLQMCEVLDYLHSQETPIVHRDFTPPNLMLCRDGMLRLIDFNVAFQAEFNSGKTIVGKRNYIPPEQFRGQSCAASDIYALGGTLFYLLSGEDPEPLSQSFPAKARPEISESLNQIVARATALELEERYATVKELAKDLEGLRQDGKPNKPLKVEPEFV